MVASRCPYRLSLAAFVRRSTSASVRYSRVRHSAFGRRRGVTTVRISVVGATSLRCDLAIEIKPPHHLTVRRIALLRTVFKTYLRLAGNECRRRSLVLATGCAPCPHGPSDE